ncbi:DUF429 domain-containing protein [Arhodomonas sp. AD133]|uniref:DUF429 domain-containing protein n=1 Tax=Arhodomonas sp. AD133 TaxID=3415009 RepID=UPI003EB8372D
MRRSPARHTDRTITVEGGHHTVAAMGIDGSRHGWFYCFLDGGRFDCGLATRLESLLPRMDANTCTLVDIPIGLPERNTGPRACDTAARRMLSPGRTASVFPVPCRQAVYADCYEEASRINRSVLGRSLSRQSWAIVPKIRETDELLERHPGIRGRMRESHPELCFRALSGQPMRTGKRTPDGVHERLAVLATIVPDAPAYFAAAARHHTRASVRDDIIDALVLAICARHPAGLRSLPSEPLRDAHGLPMAIAYPGA